MKKVVNVLSVLVVLPIWYYLVWWLLKRADAGELQMFLFWVYVPVGLLCSVTTRLVEKD